MAPNHGDAMRAAMFAWDPSSLPDWLNAEGFTKKIQPLLANVTTSAIATALSVSCVYASHIRAWLETPASTALGEAGGVGGVSGTKLEGKPQSNLNLAGSAESINPRSHAHPVYLVARLRGPIDLPRCSGQQSV